MYIGPNEIEKETKTGKYVEVSYKDKLTDGGEHIKVTSEIFAKDILEAVKTEEPQDFNYIRDMRSEVIVKAILEILLEKNAKSSELNYICQRVLMSSGQNEKDAIKKVLGKDFDEMTFYEFHNILIK